MTEPNQDSGKRSFLAKTGSAAAAGGTAALRGVKWLAPRAATVATRTAGGIRKAATGLFKRLKKARAAKKDKQAST